VIQHDDALKWVVSWPCRFKARMEIRWTVAAGTYKTSSRIKQAPCPTERQMVPIPMAEIVVPPTLVIGQCRIVWSSRKSNHSRDR